MLSSWRISGSINQQNFFDKVVLSLSDGGTKRVFVIISDAFRFEVAEELVQVINSKSRFKAALSSLLVSYSNEKTKRAEILKIKVLLITQFLK